MSVRGFQNDIECPMILDSFKIHIKVDMFEKE